MARLAADGEMIFLMSEGIEVTLTGILESGR